MNWLEFNQVHINYFEKTVIFPEEARVEDVTMSVKQMNLAVNDGVVVFMLYSLTEVKGKSKSDELPVVKICFEIVPSKLDCQWWMDFQRCSRKMLVNCHPREKWNLL